MTESLQRLSALDAADDDVLARAVRASNAGDPGRAALQRIGEAVTAGIAARAGTSLGVVGATRALRALQMLGVVAVAVGLSMYRLASHEDSVPERKPPRASVAREIAPMPPASLATKSLIAPAAPLPLAPPTSRATKPPRAAPRASASPPSELDLLRAAEASLGGDPRAALARTDEHLRAYPNGLLAQEREYLAIDALVRLGRQAAAEARARRFEARHPQSPLLRRLARVLGTGAPFGKRASDRTSTEEREMQP